MHEQVEKPKDNKSRSVANSVTQKKSNGKQGFGIEDNRPEAIMQRKRRKTIQESSLQKKTSNGTKLNSNIDTKLSSCTPSHLLIQCNRKKSRGRKKHPNTEPSYRNLKRMDEQSPVLEMDESTGVLSIKLYDGYKAKQRHYDFSLSRHWFPWLNSSANDKNSVMHDDMSQSDIEADGRDIGLHIIADIWGKGPVEPNLDKHTISSGRKYQLDTVGSSNELNHFFVISGPKVMNVDALQYQFFRALSQLGWKDDIVDSEVKALYRQLDGSLTHQEIKEVSGINIEDADGLNLPDVKYFIEKVKLAGYIKYSQLNNRTWDDPGNGLSLFGKPHDVIKKSYDIANELGRLDEGDVGVKLK